MSDFYGLRESSASISRMVAEGFIVAVSGKLLEEFEEAAANLFGNRFGVATCNGTAAIHVGLYGVGVGPGDEVLLPTYGYHGMAVPINCLGARPVFCDVDPETLCLDPEDCAKRITTRTKAILALHPWGNPCHLDALEDLAHGHGLALVSDASHAHGARWKRRPIGSFSHVLCASMGPGKLITGGELGVATTDDPRIRDRMLLFGHVNRVPEALGTEEYKGIDNAVGLKIRPHALALRLALDQLHTFQGREARLSERVHSLALRVQDAGFGVQESYGSATRTFWKLIVRGTPELLQRLRRRASDRSLRLETDHYDPPLHRSTIFTRYYGLSEVSLPRAEALQGTLVQIHAIDLWDDGLMGQYLGLFENE